MIHLRRTAIASGELLHDVDFNDLGRDLKHPSPFRHLASRARKLLYDIMMQVIYYSYFGVLVIHAGSWINAQSTYMPGWGLFA